MSLVQVGQMLIQERKKRGLDLISISKVTRINRYHLKALEEGDESLFKSQVQLRGFIQSYSKALGLLDDQILNLLDSKSLTPSLRSIKKIENLDISWNKIFTLDNIFLSFCIVFFSGSILWMHWTLDNLGEEDRSIQSITNLLSSQYIRSYSPEIKPEKELSSKEKSDKVLKDLKKK